MSSYKEGLSKAKTNYYTTLIGNQQKKNRMLFSTINCLLRPIDTPQPPVEPDCCTKDLDFFQAKVDLIHQQLLVCAQSTSNGPFSQQTF